MRRITILFIAILAANAGTFAQETFVRKDIAKFDKIIVSPHINLVLTEGSAEEVTIEYLNVTPAEVNVEVNGSTLNLFLNESRYVPKTEKVSEMNYDYREDIYKNAQITAYVTYTYLSALEIRGDQQVTCKTPINTVRFKLKTYGNNRVDLSYLDAEDLKVVSYGESEIDIRDGKVNSQKYVLYGSSHVDVSKMKSAYSKAKIYGESQLVLHASDELDVSAFGQPTITFYGDPVVSKNIIIGEPRILKVK